MTAGALSRRPPALIVALALLVAAPAAAQEFKLVLTPEVGHAPPARVCLASRSPSMADASARIETLRRLADVATCDAHGCETPRELRPARCRICPDATHDACRPRVDLGEWKPTDYTLACADDDTSPSEGGTIYIAVESVEAENPPLIYSFEVSGGRVRWSSVDPISKPSYRVLGGDFEASRLSYPRIATEQPWAEVPVRRRCRCLDVSRPGPGEIGDVRVDGQPVCRGEPHSITLVPVELPASERDEVRSLTIETATASGASRWSTRWPTAPVQPTLRRFAFTWVMPCEWPRLDRCPAIQIRGAACPSPDADGDRCHYDCEVLAENSVTLPTEMTLHLGDPTLDFSAILGAPGQTVVSPLPAEDRVVWADVSEWKRHVVGDRIRALEVLTPDGTLRTIELHDRIADRLTIPLPRARCGTSLRTHIIGERDYAPGYGLIERGARLDLPPPDALAVWWDVHLALEGAGVLNVFDVSKTNQDINITFGAIASAGLRIRPDHSRYFLDARLVNLVVGGWPWGPITESRGPSNHTETITYNALAFEAAVGASWLLDGRTQHTFGGLGLGSSFSLFSPGDLVEQGRTMGTVFISTNWPLKNDLTAYLNGKVTLRYWFGSRNMRYSTAFDGSLRRDLRPVHVLLLSMGLDLKL